jgi:hypothetical protein
MVVVVVVVLLREMGRGVVIIGRSRQGPAGQAALHQRLYVTLVCCAMILGCDVLGESGGGYSTTNLGPTHPVLAVEPCALIIAARVFTTTCFMGNGAF